jgi:hypothetical protein
MTSTDCAPSAFVALLLVALAACYPSPPTEADARHIIESDLRAADTALVRLATFSKTGGARRSMEFGGPIYTLTWRAELAFSDDALWCYPFTVRRYGRQQDRHSPGAREMHRGDSGSVNGSFTFSYNEQAGVHAGKGWRLEETKYGDSSRSCR